MTTSRIAAVRPVLTVRSKHAADTLRVPACDVSLADLLTTEAETDYEAFEGERLALEEKIARLEREKDDWKVRPGAHPQRAHPSPFSTAGPRP